MKSDCVWFWALPCNIAAVDSFFPWIDGEKLSCKAIEKQSKPESVQYLLVGCHSRAIWTLARNSDFYKNNLVPPSNLHS